MSDLSKPEHVRRHEAVAANARRAQVASADVMQTVALLGETVEDLKARMPIMRGLDAWLARIEGKLDRVLKAVEPQPIQPAPAELTTVEDRNAFYQEQWARRR